MADGEWPRCGAKVESIEPGFVCVLPAHHELDGQEMHENVDGRRWRVMSKQADGEWKRIL